MKRREFIKATALAGSGLFALKNLSPTAWAAENASSGMPYGPLGRTGVQVSKLGIGTAPLGRNDTDVGKVVRIIGKAIDEGINYMDVAPNYSRGESERRLGTALKGKRDQVFLVTKTEADTYTGTMELLEQSLKHLQTDHVDLVHIHNLGHLERWKDLDFAFSEKGAMGALRKAREQGKVRFIGASGHLHPSRFHYAIDSGEIDVMMNAVNFVNQHTYDFEHKVWARALEKNIGLVSMKVLGGNLDGEFRLPKEDYENAIRYTLSLKGLCTAVVGINKMEHLDQLLETFRRVDALNEEEFLAVAQRGLDLLKEDATWRSVHGLPVT
jgi:aryl-alcohol dehydrogenase-like predicted oxidoreductase